MTKYSLQKQKLRRKTYRQSERSLMIAGFPTSNPSKFKKEVKKAYQFRYRKR